MPADRDSAPVHRAPTRALLVVVVLCAALLASVAGQASAAPVHGASSKGRFSALFGPSGYAPGELIVRYRRGTSAAVVASRRSARAEARSRGARVAGLGGNLRGGSGPAMELVRLRTGETVAHALRRLRANPGVAWAEPNYYRRAMATPNDPEFGDLWNLHNTGQSVQTQFYFDEVAFRFDGRADSDIDAPEAWDLTTGDASVIVAVLDTGMLADHPDLNANVFINAGEYGDGRQSNKVDDDNNGFVDDWRGWDFAGNASRDDNDPFDRALHGTHVAGTIGAVGNNGIGISGVAWNVKLLPVKILDSRGFGTVADAVKGYRYAAEMGATVVNGSFGGPGISRAEQETIRELDEVLFVFAAGNEGSDNDLEPGSDGVSIEIDGRPAAADDDDESEEFFFGGGGPDYPASFARSMQHVMSVGASTMRDGRAPFSNYGRHSVDLAAPGYPVLSTFRGFSVLDELFLEDIQYRWSTGGTNDQWQWNNRDLIVMSNPVIFKKTCRTFRYDDEEEDDAALGTSELRTVRICAPLPTGRYKPNSNAWLQLDEPIDLSARTGCKLSVELYHDLQKNRDFLLVEGSFDGTTWRELARMTGTRSRAPRISLADFDNAPAMRLRFRLVTDASGSGEGVFLGHVYLDDCRQIPYNTDWLAGTSMSAPHVAGAAALVYSLHPAADPAWVRTAIDAGADRIPTWKGKTRSGGRLNVRGALDQADSVALAVPVSFGLGQPDSGARISDPTPTFTWQASGADSGIVRYELYVDGKLARSVAGDARRSVAIQRRLSAGAHRWRVEAVDAQGDRRSSATRSFRVLARVSVALHQLDARGRERSCGTTRPGACVYRGRVATRLASTVGAHANGARATWTFYRRTPRGHWVRKLVRRSAVRSGVARLDMPGDDLYCCVWRVRLQLAASAGSQPARSDFTYLVRL